MKQKFCSLSLAAILFIAPSFSHAGVVINEIMYDVSGTDSGREWIEIYNPDSASVDVSSYKFLESADASNHGLTVTSGSAVIPAGGYAIIVSDSAKFLTDNSSFSGTILKASFSSLSNTGSTLILKSGTAVIDQASYTSSLGAAGTGNSLQKTSGGFIPALPTPGATNATTAVIESTSGSSGGSGGTSTTTTTTATSTDTTATTTSVTNSTNTEVLSAHSSTQLVTYVVDNPGLKVDAGRHRIITTNMPIEFEAAVSGLAGNVSYEWSFGDGTTGSGKIVNHNYLFVGDYVVVVNINNGINKAVSRTEVKVVAPSVVIGEVGRSANGYVELKNTGQYEVNIQSWRIKSGNDELVFPRDTIIKSNSGVKFPFKFGENSSGDVAISYGDNIVADSVGIPTFSNVTYKEPSREEIEIAKAKVAKEFVLAESHTISNPETTNLVPLNIETLNTETPSQFLGASSSSIIDSLDTSKENENFSLLASPLKVFNLLKDFFTK